MLTGRFPLKLDRDGHIFIDRDPTHFRKILNYLRTGQIVLPSSKEDRLELLLESQFYGTEEITAKVLQPQQDSCRLLTGWISQIYLTFGLVEGKNSFFMNGRGIPLVFTNIKWPGGPMTVEFWYRAVESAPQPIPVFWFRGFVNGNSSRFALFAPWKGGHTALDYFGTESTSLSSRLSGEPASFDPSQWHHVAATSHGRGGQERGMKLFVDGVEIASSNESDEPFGSSGTLIIGGGGESSQLFLKGLLRDFRIWSVSRTAEEISTTLNSNLSGTESNLWFFLPFNKFVDDGAEVVDATGRHRGQLQSGKGEWRLFDPDRIFDEPHS